MRDIDLLFEKLRKSGFRSGFKLMGRELDYLNAKGLDVILSHGRDFIDKRLASASRLLYVTIPYLSLSMQRLLAAGDALRNGTKYPKKITS